MTLRFSIIPFVFACSSYDDDPDGAYERTYGDADSPEVISGYACAPSGAPLAMAEVTVAFDSNMDGEPDSTSVIYTDLYGEFELANQPAGSYSFTIVKGKHQMQAQADYTGQDRLNLPDMCIDAGDLQIGVFDGAYDSIEEIIDYLGFPYTFYSDAEEESVLLNTETLASHDVLFFNCGGGESGLSDQAIENVRSYVQAGGTIYASDWAYSVVERAFPDMVEFYGEPGSPTVGPQQTVVAEVIDPNLQLLLGEDADIYYQLSAWVVTTGMGAGSTELLRGSPSVDGGSVSDAPLTVVAQHGKGEALYTTFHNEAQATADAKQILYEFVFNL